MSPSEPGSDLQLLLAHAGEGSAVLPDGLPDNALTGGGEEEPEPETDGTEAGYLWNEGADPQDLSEQRWGVIIPDSARGDRLLDLVGPLIARRAAQQGDEVRIYRVKPNMTPDESSIWKRNNLNPQSDFGLEVPKYQVILGDLEEVSLPVQQALGTDGFVGRIVFDHDDDYRSYVDKVLRWEDKPSELDIGDSLFFTVNDGTGATRVGRRALMEPGLALAKKYHAKGRYAAEQIIDAGDPMVPNPDEFLELVRRDRPAALFSVSHGEGPPRMGWANGEAQRAGQGAMSFGREGHILAADLPDAPFLPGGIWFMLACYGGGTPGASAYRHWLEQLRSVGKFSGSADAVLKGIPKEGDRPFIAAIPKKVLASTDGPLAFVGHIDLAWTYAFQELDQGVQSRMGRFLGVLRMLLDGDRVGVAMRDLLRAINDFNQHLTSIQDAQQASGGGDNPNWLGHLWMARQDLASYVLLGDPAVRLPFARYANLPVPAWSGGGAAVQSGGAPAGRPDLTVVENAILHLLLGHGTAGDLAGGAGVNASELTSLAETYRAGGRAAVAGRLQG